MKKLDSGWIDLYLLHQPYFDVPGEWQALEEAKKAGKLKSIGVSNMTPNLWEKYVTKFATPPAINQVEFNPYFQQKPLRKILDAADVRLEAWYPLGHGDKKLLDDPVITKLAQKYGKNSGQIILRFEVQNGAIVLPKSTNPERIASNLDIFDFELTPEEMEQICGLDTGKGAHDPEKPGMGQWLMVNYKVHD